MSIKPAIDASFEGAKNAEMRGFRFIHWGKANEQVGPVLEEDIFSQLCPDQSKGIWVQLVFGCSLGKTNQALKT